MIEGQHKEPVNRTGLDPIMTMGIPFELWILSVTFAAGFSISLRAPYIGIPLGVFALWAFRFLHSQDSLFFRVYIRNLRISTHLDT